MLDLNGPAAGRVDDHININKPNVRQNFHILLVLLLRELGCAWLCLRFQPSHRHIQVLNGELFLSSSCIKAYPGPWTDPDNTKKKEFGTRHFVTDRPFLVSEATPKQSSNP